MEVFDAPARFYSAGTLPLDELAYWIAFSRVLGIGPVRFKQLLDFFHEDVAAAWHATSKELAQAGLDQKVIEGFATELAKGEVTVVSGLALGIDTIAHTAALDAGGRTVAVMGNGLDLIYPSSNHNLARRIVESGQGALVTEFPLGVKPDGKNFPARNRIISGLSLGVLVTEAPQPSGSLITANFALEQGREVFAVPGSILSPGSAGVNKLIQDGGARLVMNINDILEVLNLFMVPQQVEMQAALPDNAEERTLLSLLSHEPCHIDDLIRESDLPTTTVSATLTVMELKGLVKSVGGMQFVLAR